MKKFKLYAIFVMAMAIIVTVAVVSCKKETSNALMGNNNESVQTFNPREIEDMNAYLKDFKQKMKSATKGEDEALSIEDAAWHLASVANYDFGHANVECDDVRFDTLFAQVNITNGSVLLSDLAVAYQSISSSIEFYYSLTLDNKHFRFIDTFISENGEVVITLITTFTRGSKYLGDTCYYFQDEYQALVACDSLFPAISYPVQTTGTSELQRILNILVCRPLNPFIYYTPSYNMQFYYRDYIDSFGSPCYKNSRLFASVTEDDDIKSMICYLLDSYLGLGIEYCQTDVYILGWSIEYKEHEPPMQGEHLTKQHHLLKVRYGEQHEMEPEPGHHEY